MGGYFWIETQAGLFLENDKQIPPRQKWSKFSSKFQEKIFDKKKLIFFFRIFFFWDHLGHVPINKIMSPLVDGVWGE